MKAKFSKTLQGYVGRIDESSTIYFHSKYKRYILRRIFPREPTEANIKFGNTTKHLYALNPSAEYRAQLKEYLDLYNNLPKHRDEKLTTWAQLYIKLMWKMHHIYKVDLQGIVDEDFVDLPCRSVACAVEHGLLPKVKDYWRFNALI